MKRIVALALAVITVMCMIPASMLSAFARGKGVNDNTTANQSVTLADGQAIPETIVVDGVFNDTGWPDIAWKEVHTETGTWDKQYPDNMDLGYEYQLSKDYYYVYGGFKLPLSAKKVYIYLKDPTEGDADGYTSLVLYDIENSEVICTRANGDLFGNHKTNQVAQRLSYKLAAGDGVNNLEIRIPLRDVYKVSETNQLLDYTEYDIQINYYVAVEFANGDSLYHPQIAPGMADGYDIDANFPQATEDASGNVTGVTWPANNAGAGVVTGAQIRDPESDNSIKTEITIDGKFNEAAWINMTDWTMRNFAVSNLADYKNWDLKSLANLWPNSFAVNDGQGTMKTQSAVYYDSSVHKVYGSMAAYLPGDTANGRQIMVHVYDAAGNEITAAQKQLNYNTTAYPGQLGMKISGNVYWFEFETANITTAPATYKITMNGTPSAAFKVETFSWNQNARFDEDNWIGKQCWPSVSTITSYVYGAGRSNSVTDRNMNFGYDLTADNEFLYGAANIEIGSNEGWKFGDPNGDGSDADRFQFYMQNLYTASQAVLGKKWNTFGYEIWIDTNGQAHIYGIHADGSSIADTSTAAAVVVQEEKNGVMVDADIRIEFRIPMYSLGLAIDPEISHEYTYTENGTTYDGEKVNGTLQSGSRTLFKYYVAVAGAEDGDDGLYFPSGNTNTGYSLLDAMAKAPGTLGTQFYEWDLRNVIDLDGKLAEDTWNNMTYISHKDSIYRWFPEAGVPLDFHGDLLVGFQALYLGMEIEESINKDSNIRIWLNNKADGTGKSYVYDITYTWTSATTGKYKVMKYDPDKGTYTPVTDNVRGNMAVGSGKTTMEIMIPLYRFGANFDSGFSYFIEVEQDVYTTDEDGNATLADHLSLMTPPVRIPDNPNYSDTLPTATNWETKYQGTPRMLKHFVPEEIEIDGLLTENGWDPTKWIHADSDYNATVQNTEKDMEEILPVSYYYQVRMDEDYLYFAGVMIYYNSDGTSATAAQMAERESKFKLWIKVGENGEIGANTDKGTGDAYDPRNGYTGVNSFTHLFEVFYDANGTGYLNASGGKITGDEEYDVTVGAVGGTGLPANNRVRAAHNTVANYPNGGRSLYDKNGQIVVDKNGVKLENSVTTTELKYGETALYGENFTAVMEKEGAVVDTSSGRTQGEYSTPTAKWTRQGDEHGTMVNGKGKSFNCTEYIALNQLAGNTANPSALTENTAVCEFKIKLSDFLGEDTEQDFHYSVEGTTYGINNSTKGQYNLHYPMVAIEQESGGNYRYYNMPFWHWGENTGILVNEDYRASEALRTYKKPVVTLGAKVAEQYSHPYTGETVRAMRFGSLYTEEYIREIAGITDKNNPHLAGDGRTDYYTDYWDVKSMGMLVMPTDLVPVGEDGLPDLAPSTVGLNGTARPQVSEADDIIDWVGNKQATLDPYNNFADYNSFAFYVSMYGIPDSATNRKFSFRSYISYYTENGSAPYYDTVMERCYDTVAAASGLEDYMPEAAVIPPDDITIKISKVNTATMGSLSGTTWTHTHTDTSPENNWNDHNILVALVSESPVKAGTLESYNYQYWQKILLEMDEESGVFNVIAKEGSGANYNAYRDWTLGPNRIMIGVYSSSDNVNMFGTTYKSVLDESDEETKYVVQSEAVNAVGAYNALEIGDALYFIGDFGALFDIDGYQAVNAGTSGKKDGDFMLVTRRPDDWYGKPDESAAESSGEDSSDDVAEETPETGFDINYANDSPTGTSAYSTQNRVYAYTEENATALTGLDYFYNVLLKFDRTVGKYTVCATSAAGNTDYKQWLIGGDYIMFAAHATQNPDSLIHELSVGDVIEYTNGGYPSKLQSASKVCSYSFKRTGTTEDIPEVNYAPTYEETVDLTINVTRANTAWGDETYAHYYAFTEGKVNGAIVAWHKVILGVNADGTFTVKEIVATGTGYPNYTTEPEPGANEVILAYATGKNDDGSKYFDGSELEKLAVGDNLRLVEGQTLNQLKNASGSCDFTFERFTVTETSGGGDTSPDTSDDTSDDSSDDTSDDTSTVVQEFVVTEANDIHMITDATEYNELIIYATNSASKVFADEATGITLGWWNCVLLEYNSTTGKYTVKDVSFAASGVEATNYASWTYGTDTNTLVLATFWNNGENEIANALATLKVGDVLTVTSGQTFTEIGDYPNAGLPYTSSSSGITYSEITFALMGGTTPEPDVQIGSVALGSTVTAPAYGESADLTGKVTAENGANYTVTDAKWTAGGATFTGSTFAEETAYTLVMTLTPNDGYAFTSSTAVTFGGEAVTSKTLNADGTLTVTVAYPATEEAPDVVIGSVAPVNGVTAPAIGADASLVGKVTAESNANYTLTSKWTADGADFSGATFAGGTAYTLVITLTPNDGYAFNASTAATFGSETVVKTLNADGTLTLKVTYAATATFNPNVVTVSAKNNASYGQAGGGTYNYDTDTFIYASATAGQDAATWTNSYKILMDYDSATNTYLVVDIEGASTTKVANWDYGGNRVVLYCFTAYHDTALAGKFAAMKVGERYSANVAHSTIQSAASGALAVTFTQVETVSTAIQKVEVSTLDNLASSAPNEINVVYVPLDNRPVHIDRVVAGAAAAGINLILPPDESMYATVLGTSGHGGDTVALLNWLKKQENEVGVDYYIIALDQVFSGGLVNSRYHVENYNGSVDYTHSNGFNDKDAADFLIELAKNNFVVYTETLMRLATTGNYKEHLDSFYGQFREYGEKDRKQIQVGDALFNIDGIVSTYLYDAKDGYYTPTSATASYIQGYVDARERKLRLIDYVVRGAGANINHLLLGADDSSEGDNLQINDTRYIINLCDTIGINYTQFAGADEMGVMALAALTTDLYRTEAAGEDMNKVAIYVEAFGPEAAFDWQADEYDTGTLGEAINKHIEAVGGRRVYNEDEAELFYMVLLPVLENIEGGSYYWYPDNATADKQASYTELKNQLKANSQALAKKMAERLQKNQAVAAVDASERGGETTQALAYGMLMYNMDGSSRADCMNEQDYFGKLLGFSSWNTQGNRIGLALGMAVSRFNYLKSGAAVTDESNVGFLKSMTHALVKDISYQSAIDSDYTASTTVNGTTVSTPDINSKNQYYDAGYILNGYDYTYLGTSYERHGLNGSQIITGGWNEETQSFTNAEYHGYTITCGQFYPLWGRNFESTFTITVQ